jgi:hypothetical protein
LGIDAVVFTNHPGAEDEISRPNYWAGNGIMPRAVQHNNVLVCVYHVPEDDPFPFTHAYFPRRAFDELAERGHWVCARRGDGFVALYSQHALRWESDEEIRVDGPDNVWLCEMGDRAQWGSFAGFVEAVTAVQVVCTGLQVRYVSPSLGEVAFGMTGPLLVAGQPVPVHESGRFDNPYCQCAFGAEEIVVRRGEKMLHLDFVRNRRTVDSG